jgi:hypothetical protein
MAVRVVTPDPSGSDWQDQPVHRDPRRHARVVAARIRSAARPINVPTGLTAKDSRTIEERPGTYEFVHAVRGHCSHGQADQGICHGSPCAVPDTRDVVEGPPRSCAERPNMGPTPDGHVQSRGPMVGPGLWSLTR